MCAYFFITAGAILLMQGKLFGALLMGVGVAQIVFEKLEDRREKNASRDKGL